MRHNANRKLTRFFVINPKKDRRMETRFDVNENVVVKLSQDPRSHMIPGLAHDISRMGMKVQMDRQLPDGAYLQVAFPNTSENVRAFGRIMWSLPLDSRRGFEMGVMVNEWLGIRSGQDSYKDLARKRAKLDRRRKSR